MKKRNIAVIALVVVLLAAGFALPELVLALRDAALEERDDHVPVDTTPVGALAASLSRADKLRLAGETGTTEYYPLSAGVHLTEAEARRAAEKLMENVSRTLFFFTDWSCREIYPQLAVGSDDRSYVLWTAFLASDDASGELFLDDETGELLSYAIYGAEMEPVPEPEVDEVALFDLAMTVLEPFGLTPTEVYPGGDGGLVLTEGGNLTVRITVYGGFQPMLRVNC